jgi:hypothetical protein
MKRTKKKIKTILKSLISLKPQNSLSLDTAAVHQINGV